MVRGLLVTALCASLTTGGCASLSPRMTLPPVSSRMTQRPQGNEAIADFVQRFPIGSRIRIERSNQRTLRGTLMNVTPDAILVQESTRMPESPITIRIKDITRVTLDQPHAGKTVGLAIASGAGAALGVVLLLVMLWSD
jgi:hypothetical protein